MSRYITHLLDPLSVQVGKNQQQPQIRRPLQNKIARCRIDRDDILGRCLHLLLCLLLILDFLHCVRGLRSRVHFHWLFLGRRLRKALEDRASNQCLASFGYGQQNKAPLRHVHPLGYAFWRTVRSTSLFSLLRTPVSERRTRIVKRGSIVLTARPMRTMLARISTCQRRLKPESPARSVARSSPMVDWRRHGEA